MIQRIIDALHRQAKALTLLSELLAEEFTHLRGSDPQAVSGLELSIQKLIQQMFKERSQLKVMVEAIGGEGARLQQLAATMPPEQGVAVAEALAEIDGLEQHCARLSTRNAELAMALHEQSRDLIDFMQRQINPAAADSYTARGRHPRTRPQAALLQGRL